VDKKRVMAVVWAFVLGGALYVLSTQPGIGPAPSPPADQKLDPAPPAKAEPGPPTKPLPKPVPPPRPAGTPGVDRRPDGVVVTFE
jgi:hypothetical protein